MASSASNGLLTSSSAVQEKLHRRSHSPSWIIPLSLPIPCIWRGLRLLVPNPNRLYQFSVSRFGRKRGRLLLCFAFLLMIFTTFALMKQLPLPFTRNPSTLIFKREDLQRIWKWEIASGHYPSRRPIPEQVGLKLAPDNPALPPRRPRIPPWFQPPPGSVVTNTHGIGPRRTYFDIQSQPPDVAYPPRPVPGSVADLDVVMEHCDFTENKYVRDCLEVLRQGAGLDNGKRLRQGRMDDWKYIYLEQANTQNSSDPSPVRDAGQRSIPATKQNEHATDPDYGLTRKRGANWETPPIALPLPLQHHSYSSLPTPCDPENPRLFHMFWTGPFSDKPYLALLSFLYTQNVGLHLDAYPEDSAVCRPEFWVWINPGPTGAVPDSAANDMLDQLTSNPWASPFLHPRFKGIVHFKLWNITEQLDGVPELKDEWRKRDSLFNSLGRVISAPKKEQESHASSATSGNGSLRTKISPTVNHTGSKSSTSYDKLSAVISDIARFILCHRFGGIYLDADTIFLRDWEELWGWKGAFTYRWSRLERYNTAILHMNKGSALGTFLFRTAVKNDFDFHPQSVWCYIKEAHLQGLLLRLPDALFDSAWLNIEYYQRERPPQPFFTDFSDFFDTPLAKSASPLALGFDGFFRGAFSYHFHNFWRVPFDPSRNWPALGPRFEAGERVARSAARAEAIAAGITDIDLDEDGIEDDRRDLDWATVLKRTFEGYIRGERPNMYGEWIRW